jgi:hypothetical protein
LHPCLMDESVCSTSLWRITALRAIDEVKLDLSLTVMEVNISVFLSSNRAEMPVFERNMADARGRLRSVYTEIKFRCLYSNLIGHQFVAGPARADSKTPGGVARQDKSVGGANANSLIEMRRALLRTRAAVGNSRAAAPAPRAQSGLRGACGPSQPFAQGRPSAPAIPKRG